MNELAHLVDTNKKTVFIGFKLTKGQASELKKMCDSLGLKQSHFIRRAITHYQKTLQNELKKPDNAGLMMKRNTVDQ